MVQLLGVSGNASSTEFKISVSRLYPVGTATTIVIVRDYFCYKIAYRRATALFKILTIWSLFTRTSPSFSDRYLIVAVHLCS